MELGLLRKDGRGLKRHPYRYWLPEREEAWRQDPISAALMPELFETGETPFLSPRPSGEGVGGEGKETTS